MAIQGQFQKRLDIGQALLIERLGEMTHAERVEFADRLQEAVKHKRR